MSDNQSGVGAHPGARLRRLMDDHCVGLPGAFNGLVARLATRAGFEGLYVSGAAVTASYGVPDIGLLTLNEFCHVIKQVAGASGLPVIADADTGFGEGEMLRRTAWEYAAAGAAGMHIEDQVFPKRCGHLDGKTLLGVDDFAAKVERAAAARDEMGDLGFTTEHTESTERDKGGKTGGGGTGRTEVRGSEASGSGAKGSFIVCARTDAAGVTGMEDAIARGKTYLDAGADMLFPEGLKSEAEFGRFAEAARAHKEGCYLLANMTEFGKTPLIPLERFGELGYSCVIWPVSSLRSAMGEVGRLLGALKRDGHVGGVQDAMLDRKGLYEALGYEPGVEWRFPSESASES